MFVNLSKSTRCSLGAFNLVFILFYAVNSEESGVLMGIVSFFDLLVSMGRFHSSIKQQLREREEKRMVYRCITSSTNSGLNDRD